MSNLPFDVPAPLKTISLAFALGAMCALALPNWFIIPFFFIGFSGFYVLLANSPPRFKSGVLLGWGFAFGYYVTGLYWIGNALLVEGNKFAWAWPLAVCALPAALAIFNALACGIISRYYNLGKTSGFFAFVAIISFFEYLRGHLFTGFPWNLHGTIWADTLPILWPVLHVGDIYLLSVFTLFWASCFGFFYIQRNKTGIRTITIAAVTFAVVLFLGLRMPAEQPQPTLDQAKKEQATTLRIIQPNIAQHEKWDRDKMSDHFAKLVTMSEPQGNETALTLIIWPESATSYGFLNNADARIMIAEMLSAYQEKAYLITGALLREDDGSGISNSVITIDKNGGIIQRYDKSHLVPFGEYIPFHEWIPFETVTKFSGFLKGDGPTTLPIPHGPSFSPLICYEVIFPGKVTDGSNISNFIVNVTNDGWYGLSAGPYQHFAISKMRAIEENLPLVRAANTGISGLITQNGHINTATNLGEQAVLTTYLSKQVKNTNFIKPYKHYLSLCIIAILLISSIYYEWYLKQKE